MKDLPVNLRLSMVIYSRWQSKSLPVQNPHFIRLLQTRKPVPGPDIFILTRRSAQLEQPKKNARQKLMIRQFNSLMG